MIMVLNLKIKVLKIFIMKMILNIIFLHQEHLNSMELLKEKNQTLEEMVCTILCEWSFSKYFWAEAINTTYYILNRALIQSILKKISYEFWKDRKFNISYFHIFDYWYFILNNDKYNLDKFDVKSDEGIFLGYFIYNKVYRVFNKCTLAIEEFIYVVFDETIDLPLRKEDITDDDVEIWKKGWRISTWKIGRKNGWYDILFSGCQSVAKLGKFSKSDVGDERRSLVRC